MGEPLGAVSFDTEDLILVDSHDRILGNASKKTVHQPGGQLHRAFSIFIYAASDKVLLHRRSEKKPLWPGYWTNSCCSHPRRGESYQAASHRRLQEELGIQTTLTWLYQFEYQAHFGAVGSEHELCAVYAGHFDEPVEIDPHPDEVDQWGWYDIPEVDSWVAREPDSFTPWFLMEWQALRGPFSEDVAGLM